MQDLIPFVSVSLHLALTITYFATFLFLCFFFCINFAFNAMHVNEFSLSISWYDVLLVVLGTLSRDSASLPQGC